MNTILSQYLLRAILISVGLVLIVLIGLAALIEFISGLDDIQGSYQTAQVVIFTLLRLPNLAFAMLPIAALIGSLLALGALSANSEIIVMRSAGLSIRRLAAMVAVAGAVMMVLTGLFGEYIGPPLDYFARNMRTELQFETGDRPMGSDTWVRDGNVFLHLERVDADFEFGAVYIYRFDDDKHLVSIARAENSSIDANNKWRLEKVHETRFRNDGVQVDQSALQLQSFDINSDLLGSSLAKPMALSARGLLSYIKYLDRNNLDSGQYRTELWYRISRTATVLIMPILALAFVFGPLRAGGAGGRLMIGVVIGLGYYLASETLANSGQVFHLNPALIAWLPSIVLSTVTMALLARVR